MQQLSPLFLFSKLDNFHVIFRLFLLGTIISIAAVLVQFLNNDVSQDIQMVLFAMSSIVSALIITTPDIKKMINPIQKGMDKFIPNETEKLNKTKPEIQENIPSEKSQEIKDDNKPKINDPIPLIAELSDYDKKQLKDFKEQIQKFQLIVQDIKSTQTRLEKDILDAKTKIQDLKRTGSTKLDGLETAYTKIMAFKAEIDNPMNFIDKYFQLLNNQELSKKKTKPWKLLGKIPHVEFDEDLDEDTDEDNRE